TRLEFADGLVSCSRSELIEHSDVDVLAEKSNRSVRHQEMTSADMHTAKTLAIVGVDGDIVAVDASNGCRNGDAIHPLPPGFHVRAASWSPFGDFFSNK